MKNTTHCNFIPKNPTDMVYALGNFILPNLMTITAAVAAEPGTYWEEPNINGVFRLCRSKVIGELSQVTFEDANQLRYTLDAVPFTASYFLDGHPIKKPMLIPQ